MKEFKKNCYHCFSIRPKKDNFCVVLRTKISDIMNLYCDHFNPDTYIQKLEEANDTKNDDGSKRSFWLFNYLPFKLAFA